MVGARVRRRCGDRAARDLTLYKRRLSAGRWATRNSGSAIHHVALAQEFRFLTFLISRRSRFLSIISEFISSSFTLMGLPSPNAAIVWLEQQTLFSHGRQPGGFLPRPRSFSVLTRSFLCAHIPSVSSPYKVIGPHRSGPHLGPHSTLVTSLGALSPHTVAA